jgi:hypothetical protein
MTAEFERSERVWAMTPGYLTEFSEISNANLYNRMKAEADGARMEYEVARMELERRQRTHARA